MGARAFPPDIEIRKNTGVPSVGIRPRLNLIEGAFVNMVVADAPAGNEIDITIGATGLLPLTGGVLTGPIQFDVSGAVNPHITTGGGFGPLVLGTGAATVHGLAAGDVPVGGDFGVVGLAYFDSDLTCNTDIRCAEYKPIGNSRASLAAHYSTRAFSITGSIIEAWSKSHTAVTDVFRFRGGSATTSGNEGTPIGFFGGWNSTDTARHAPILVGSAVDIDPRKYAAAFTAQADPILAGFARTDPDTRIDHYWSLQHDTTAAWLRSGFGQMKVYPVNATRVAGNSTDIGDLYAFAGAYALGDVVIYDVAVDSGAITTVVTQSSLRLGIVAVIRDGTNVGIVQTEGITTVTRKNQVGATARGDYVYTTDVAGQVETSAVIVPGAVLGRALTTLAGGGAGAITFKIEKH